MNGGRQVNKTEIGTSHGTVLPRADNKKCMVLVLVYLVQLLLLRSLIISLVIESMESNSIIDVGGIFCHLSVLLDPSVGGDHVG